MNPKNPQHKSERTAAPGPAESFRAYCQLVRLPNLFTAAADVLAGFFVSHWIVRPDDLVFLWPLVFASVAFYAGGVVLNDWVDREIDARERPERPIPSGLVPAHLALKLGWGFLATGLVLAGYVAIRLRRWEVFFLALALGLLIISYNFFAKRFFWGPAVVGACRGVNFLLGAGLRPVSWSLAPLIVGLALYVTGIGVFARTEARNPRRGWLATGLCLMIVGMAVFAVFSLTAERFIVAVWRWYLLLGVLAVWMLLRGLWVLAEPSPQRVQRLVTQAVMGIIVLDAAAVFTVHGPLAALPVLALVLPATWAGRWIAST